MSVDNNSAFAPAAANSAVGAVAAASSSSGFVKGFAIKSAGAATAAKVPKLNVDIAALQSELAAMQATIEFQSKLLSQHKEQTQQKQELLKASSAAASASAGGSASAPIVAAASASGAASGAAAVGASGAATAAAAAAQTPFSTSSEVILPLKPEPILIRLFPNWDQAPDKPVTLKVLFGPPGTTAENALCSFEFYVFLVKDPGKKMAHEEAIDEESRAIIWDFTGSQRKFAEALGPSKGLERSDRDHLSSQKKFDAEAAKKADEIVEKLKILSIELKKVEDTALRFEKTDDLFYVKKLAQNPQQIPLGNYAYFKMVKGKIYHLQIMYDAGSYIYPLGCKPELFLKRNNFDSQKIETMTLYAGIQLGSERSAPIDVDTILAAKRVYAYQKALTAVRYDPTAAVTNTSSGSSGGISQSRYSGLLASSSTNPLPDLDPAKYVLHPTESEEELLGPVVKKFYTSKEWPLSGVLSAIEKRVKEIYFKRHPNREVAVFLSDFFSTYANITVWQHWEWYFYDMSFYKSLIKTIDKGDFWTVKMPDDLIGPGSFNHIRKQGQELLKRLCQRLDWMMDDLRSNGNRSVDVDWCLKVIAEDKKWIIDSLQWMLQSEETAKSLLSKNNAKFQAYREMHRTKSKAPPEWLHSEAFMRMIKEARFVYKLSLSKLDCWSCEECHAEVNSWHSWHNPRSFHNSLKCFPSTTSDTSNSASSKSLIEAARRFLAEKEKLIEAKKKAASVAGVSERAEPIRPPIKNCGSDEINWPTSHN